MLKFRRIHSSRPSVWKSRAVPRSNLTSSLSSVRAPASFRGLPSGSETIALPDGFCVHDSLT